MAAQKGITVVLKQYFGYKLGQSSLKDFSTELKDLTNDDKLELAQLAAVEMGLGPDDVKFALA